MKASRRVLVVDDERFFREAIREALAALGVEVELAGSAGEALKMADDPRIGAVVLDVRLPDLSGVEVLRRLRERHPAQRVIVLSEHTDQERVLEALRLGACDYLAKPIHEEELRLAVRRALEGFSVESRWQSLRGRLHLLGARLADLVALSRATAPDRRVGALAGPVAEAVAEVLGATRTSLLLGEPGGRQLAVIAVDGVELTPEEMDPALVGESIAGLAVTAGGPVMIDDVDTDERCAGLARRGGRYLSRSIALAPLDAGEGAFGVLCATDRDGDPRFEDEDLALLRVLALQAAPLLAAVAPTPVEAPVEAADDTTRLDLPFDGAEVVREICEAVTSEIEPGRLVAAALRPVARALDASPVSLYLLDGVSGRLELEGQVEDGVALDRPSLPRDRGLTAMALQTGQLVATDHPESDPRFDAEVDTPEGGRGGPLLCVPLRLRGKVLGVARVFPSPARGAPARAGELVAAPLSAAVRNVLLYRSLLESVEDVARARREAGPRGSS
jgi:FixJ family two-component response regulator/GAF domain-containing protein